MSAELQRILAAALKLTDNERAELLTLLVESIGDEAMDEDVLQAWLVEAKQRLEDIRSGRTSTVPAAEVFRKGRSLIEQARHRQ
jgi:putative addiction module component (TIGR02574 family)